MSNPAQPDSQNLLNPDLIPDAGWALGQQLLTPWLSAAFYASVASTVMLSQAVSFAATPETLSLIRKP